MRFNYDFFSMKGIIELQDGVTLKRLQTDEILRIWFNRFIFEDVIIGNRELGIEVLSGTLKEIKNEI
jgi:hypothetical protein